MRRFALFVAFLLLVAGCGGSAASRTPASDSSGAASATPGVASSPGRGASASPAAAASPAGASPQAIPSASVPDIRGEVTVFAAASLTEAFNEIKANLEASSTRPTITLSLAGSSQLRTQLAQGARADVFAAADERNMDGARQDGSVTAQPRIFAQNRLIVVVPAGNPADITSLADLAKRGVKLVLAQEQVPVGGYARQALDKLSQDPSFGMNFKSRVLENLVSDEANVRSVLAKVQLAEADAGIVYATDITADARDKVKTIDIPDQFNVIARYPIAPVKGAANSAGAEAFVSYVLSPAGQAVLAKYGFLPPSP